MDWLWYILISIVSGTFAGMGMGGGTFLIPLLILFMGTQQTQAQSQNLVAFVPMAIVVAIIYSFQNLVDWKKAWIVALPATIISVVAAVVAANISGKILRIVFGSFVVAVGIWQLVLIIIKRIKKNNKSTSIKVPSIKIEEEK